MTTIQDPNAQKHALFIQWLQVADNFKTAMYGKFAGITLEAFCKENGLQLSCYHCKCSRRILLQTLVLKFQQGKSDVCLFNGLVKVTLLSRLCLASFQGRVCSSFAKLTILDYQELLPRLVSTACWNCSLAINSNSSRTRFVNPINGT